MRRPDLRMTRRRWRVVLLYAGILPALVLLAYGGVVVRMLAIQHDGDRSYVKDTLEHAADRYHAAGHHNPFEDWVSAFDAGAARHADGQYSAAIKAYKAALDFGVPHRDECTVRINLALGYEAIGDAAAKGNHLDEADDDYDAGIAALEDAKCPTDSGRGKQQSRDAKAVDDRLHKKKQQDQKKKQQQRKQRQKEQKKSAQQKKKEQQQRRREQQQEKQRQQQLQKQNQQGQELRKKQDGRDNGSGYQPAW